MRTFGLKRRGLRIFMKSLIPIAIENGFSFKTRKEKEKPTRTETSPTYHSGGWHVRAGQKISLCAWRKANASLLPYCS